MNTENNIIEKIKTVMDAMAFMGLEIKSFSADGDVINDFNACIVCMALNEGWKTNPNDLIWFPYYNRKTHLFELSGINYDCWFTDTIVRSRYGFKSGPLSDYAGIQFPELFRPTY